MHKQRLVYYTLESLAIIAAIAFVAWRVHRPQEIKAATAEAEPAKTAAKPSEVKIPEVSEVEQLKNVLHQEFMEPAQEKWRTANLAETPEDRKRALYKEVLALDERFRDRVGPLFENRKYYEAPEYEWLTDDLTLVNQRTRVIRDFLRSTEPAVAAPAGGAK